MAAYPLLPDCAGFSPSLVVAIADAGTSISELSGRISASPVAHAWRRRASWAGYARAMQLQGSEIDEIDVFSWACDLFLPERPRHSTVFNDFESYEPWFSALGSGRQDSWRDALPFTPRLSPEQPRIVQALELVRQYALWTDGIAAWLALPDFLHRLGLTTTPLPCLVAGSKALRLKASVPEETVRSTLRSLAHSAKVNLDVLDAIEAQHRASIRSVLAEYRAGKLPDLLALNLFVPLLSPKRVSSELRISIAGAGKLLERACTLGVLTEISGRASWKVYLPPDLAITFGFRRPPVGRPPKEATFSPADTSLAEMLEAFDRQMAEITDRLAPRP